MAESDTQNLPGPDGVWKIERSEQDEKILDAKGKIRYQGKHSMTAVHFAFCLRRYDAIEKVALEAMRKLQENLGADDETALQIHKAVFGDPKDWKRLDVKTGKITPTDKATELD